MIIYTHTMLLLLPPVDGADRQKECMEMSAENGKRWESFLFFEPFGERWPNQKDRRGGNSIRTHYTYHGARKPRRDFLATHTHTPFISLGMSTAVKQRCHDLYIYKSRGVRTRIILPSERYKRGVSPTGENGQGVLFSVATSSCSPTQHQTARCLIKNYTFGWRAVGRVNTYIPCESLFVLFCFSFLYFLFVFGGNKRNNPFQQVLLAAFDSFDLQRKIECAPAPTMDFLFIRFFEYCNDWVANYIFGSKTVCFFTKNLLRTLMPEKI